MNGLGDNEGPPWRSLVEVTASDGRTYAAEKVLRPRWKRIGLDEPVPTEPHILVEHSRGVQVGERNVQVNTYDLRVTSLRADLDAVLGRHDVQRALTDFAKDPTDAVLRENADRALGTRGFFATQPTLVVERGEITDSTVRPDTIFGFLFVRHCDGVQVGEGNRQENHFAYVGDATVDARELFARSPELRDAVIDSIRSPHDAPELRDSLDEAVADVVGHAVDVRSLGASIVPRRDARVTVTDKDGVSIGHSCRWVGDAHVSGALTDAPDITRGSARIARDAATEQRREDRLARLERKQAVRETRAEIARERKLYGDPAEAPQRDLDHDAAEAPARDLDDEVVEAPGRDLDDDVVEAPGRDLDDDVVEAPERELRDDVVVPPQRNRHDGPWDVYRDLDHDVDEPEFGLFR